ncbi:MAG: endonuclease/exonuclease/phosphatase family protein [Bacteroides sp.]|nr:endonuclease/exonuclease/phosphatase family protein [Bacteroides sp.]
MASYNIRNGISISDSRDLTATADIVNLISPDIIAIQEVDSATRRCDGQYVGGALADMTDMFPLYSAAIDYEGGKYGVGMLCKNAPDSVVRIPLPGREESRTALIAFWPDIVVCSTHLSLNSEDCKSGAILLADTLVKLSNGRPAFIMGDFNTTADDGLWTLLETKYGFKRVAGYDSPTFPSDEPQETLDYILIYSPATKVGTSNITVAQSTASDHRPIYTDIEF